MNPADKNIAVDSRFKIFHDLMSQKVRNVLIISKKYDAWMMEEDCRLSEKVVSEYRGLNLSHPPRLEWVSYTDEAIGILCRTHFDLVIIIAREIDSNIAKNAAAIKKNNSRLPVILLLHQAAQWPDSHVQMGLPQIVDQTFLWNGNTSVLLAIIKSAEDMMNVDKDTELAGIRVLLFIEDSPEYTSAILPILYRELVIQAQSVMEERLNEEHRLLAMRARPKILLASNFETAMNLYEKYKDFILGVISDVRFPRHGQVDEDAGVKLLAKIKSERFDIPLLLASSESHNAARAAQIPARFMDKNSASLPSAIRRYFQEDLGFGEFVFKNPDGKEIARAAHLRELEKKLKVISKESFLYHCQKNDFSRWLFARTEIELAAELRPIRDAHYQNAQSHCEHLIDIIHQCRMLRQKGIVIDFDSKDIDQDTEFCKIGSGSLGGKARGLAFMNTLLHQNTRLKDKYPGVDISIPQTVVITSEGFQDCIEFNDLEYLATSNLSDDLIAEHFLNAQLPEGLVCRVREYLKRTNCPLAVRSSGLLEDAQYRAYAGLYNTYMLANDDNDLECRLVQLLNALKMVYASTYFSEPKAFSRKVGQRTEEEKMAVIIQELAGSKHGKYFYPAISGVAQSCNYYPFAKMVPSDGVASIALGLGKTVMGGESSLRFSPRYPTILPDRSIVDDILKNSQQYFYALPMGDATCRLGTDDSTMLDRREIDSAVSEPPVQLLASTFYPNDGRIRDCYSQNGHPVITFHSILKYGLFPLAPILKDLLAIGKEGMGSDVEMEFCVNFDNSQLSEGTFSILQLRPMGAREELMRVDIDDKEMDRAWIFSGQALGNTIMPGIEALVFVRPENFIPAKTAEIAREISAINAEYIKAKKNYLLIGPGRWGSADHWLGIPVKWEDISEVCAIVETDYPNLKAEPSQGSHFFHNITTLGINYITISRKTGGHIDWSILNSLPAQKKTEHVSVVSLDQSLLLKVDGKKGQAVILPGSKKEDN